MGVPAKFTAQQSPCLHILGNARLGQGSRSVLRARERGGSCVLFQWTWLCRCLGLRPGQAWRPGSGGARPVCALGLQPGGSRVCGPGIRDRGAAGPRAQCARRRAPFLPLPALAVAGRPGGPWTASAFSWCLSSQADLPGSPGVSDWGSPCSDVTSPYLITSAVSRPRSQVLGVRALTCLLLRAIEFNP